MNNSEYKGLSNKEVIESRNKYGSNELEKKKKENIFIKLLHINSSPMFLLLLFAASIYFLLGEVLDGIIMLFFVLFTSFISYFEEEKTDRALEELNKLSSLDVKVIRNGKKEIIDSRDVVVDDLVILEEGDKVPADGIIIDCQGLGINESSLTGESDIVYKKLRDVSSEHFRSNMCYMGSDVVNGNAIIKITDIGRNTEYGKIGSELNNIKKNKTLLEKQIDRLIVVCTIISFLFFIMTMVVNYINNANLLLKERIIKSILSGITIAMGTIPEEIPVVLTVFLALGAWSLTKKNALTRNMKAVETLGTVSVLCTDKTGTITQNKMIVKEIYSKCEEFYKIAYLACNKSSNDPMENAIKEFSLDKIIDKQLYSNPLIHEYVFNTEDKMMGQIWNIGNEKILCVKGAYENVLSLCDINKSDYEKILEKIDEYSKNGYRIIAVAKKENIIKIADKLKDNKLEFVGLIALLDPPRRGIKESLEMCYDASIRVIMITGDNGETAKGIASQIGLKHNDKVITGTELEKMSDSELEEEVKTTNIFARVYPNHKMRIVTALQKNGEVVAMTGDGVNDATALKKADIGIAMGKRGTSVSKEAADIILMDDNFNTIVEAIKNGRAIYDNIKKAIYYILIIHIPIILSSVIIPLCKLPILFLPVHIVLLELIIDPTSSIIFQRLSCDKNIMNKEPRKLDEKLIKFPKLIRVIFQGISIFILMLFSYKHLIDIGYSFEYARGIAFSILVLSNIFITYVIASDEYAYKNFISILKDKLTVFINSVMILVLSMIIYIPFLRNVTEIEKIGLDGIIYIVIISFIGTISFDLFKIKANK